MAKLSILSDVPRNSPPYNGNLDVFSHFSNYLALQVPKQLSECRLKTNQSDKIFTSTWLGNDKIVAGTKCNRVLLWDLLSKQPTVPTLINLPRGENPYLQDRCGQHAMKINPSSSLFACGAQNEAEIAIFSLPDLEPVTVLSGHTNWVFGIDFLSDDLLVSGSRDSNINFWRIEKSPSSITRPIKSVKAHIEKTRDVVVCRKKQVIYSLGCERIVKQWDAETCLNTMAIPLGEKEDPVCVAYSSEKGILAVGSQDCLTLIDPRLHGSIARAPTQNLDWGIRSLCWKDFIISSGGGIGRVTFYDIRYNQFLDLDNDRKYISTGKGYLLPDNNYNAYFGGLNIPNAAFTHCYDPTGLRMFVGGGPLNAPMLRYGRSVCTLF